MYLLYSFTLLNSCLSFFAHVLCDDDKLDPFRTWILNLSSVCCTLGASKDSQERPRDENDNLRLGSRG